MLYDVKWYSGEQEIESVEERIEWDWYCLVMSWYMMEDIEEIVWEMWYDGLLDGDVKFEDWMRIVDVLLNGRWY